MSSASGSSAGDVAIVVPASAGPRQGNAVTAERYARIFAALGRRAQVTSGWRGGSERLLVALHARKSAASVERFAREHPDRPRVVVLTGTDVYVDGVAHAEVARSLGLATRIVALQPAMLAELDPRSRERATVILQSAQPLARRPAAREDVFEVAQLAHLRDVKDPLLAARAARGLRASSRIVVVHAGRALDPRWESLARAEAAANPRYRWLGDLAHEAAQELLGRARVFVQTSLVEGGSGALSEALVNGVPVLATCIPAASAVLGDDHPGLFATRDEHALAELLARCERESGFLEALRARSVALAPRFTLERERDAWRAVLDELAA